ncbi:hypothetical protein [Pyrococcus sp. ST04]|uniref:hypothetical protein n=1 Tax=Pyrococcus sp. ST04 TaxID=1183377 RepID=UPI00064FE4F9|nr:hypothetical protein [Pyrococcus sp. ST04]
MPWGSSTPSGWISVVIELIILVILIFGIYQVNRTLNELKLELNNLKNTLEEVKKNTEETRRKLEEV